MESGDEGRHDRSVFELETKDAILMSLDKLYDESERLMIKLDVSARNEGALHIWQRHPSGC